MMSLKADIAVQWSDSLYRLDKGRTHRKGWQEIFRFSETEDPKSQRMGKKGLPSRVICSAQHWPPTLRQQIVE
jgi:hypothetical protein